MNKQTEQARLTISISPKLNTQIRIEAAKSGLSLSEMIEKYRER
jgi:predicted HicB family RNase H-like nuclease